jgi:twitching motility protein PilT
LERIIGVFEGPAQKQIILQLSSTLQGIISQELLPSVDRARRTLAYELLVATTAVRNVIRENQLHMLETVIQTGAKEGMMLFDTCLYDLYCRCQVNYDVALSRARHPERLAKRTA